MKPFPAVLIGGPPHSGKSVLAYSLTQALRQRQIDHYVLRAYPDGEGDWSNEAEPETVRILRVKGQGTPEWIARMCRDIDRRHLPLLVDVGGRPQPWQEAVFDCCTHAVLLTPDEAARARWLELMDRHCVPLLADLHSTLQGVGVIEQEQPVLRGTLVGLHRNTTATGPAFAALLELLTALFHYPQGEVHRQHLDAAPSEIPLDLDRLKENMGIGSAAEMWQPHSLPQVLDYLPPQVSLGLYGRAPNWLYAALALFAHPAELWQFDPRLGWVQPPILTIGQPPADSPLQFEMHLKSDCVWLDCRLPHSYLDYPDAQDLIAPDLPAGAGLILGGKLPHWLLNGLALAYRNQPWLAVYQPQIPGAVIIHSCRPELPIGQIVSDSEQTRPSYA